MYTLLVRKKNIKTLAVTCSGFQTLKDHKQSMSSRNPPPALAKSFPIHRRRALNRRGGRRCQEAAGRGGRTLPGPSPRVPRRAATAPLPGGRRARNGRQRRTKWGGSTLEIRLDTVMQYKGCKAKCPLVVICPLEMQLVDTMALPLRFREPNAPSSGPRSRCACNTPNVLPGCRAQLSSPLPSPVLILAPEASRTGQLTSVLKSPTPLPLPLVRVPSHGCHGHEPSSPLLEPHVPQTLAPFLHCCRHPKLRLPPAAVDCLLR